MAGRILVGTSGWNYPTGKGTWNGVFYPARRGRGFDELAYYAEHFDTVEINSTFYRVPDAALVASWLRRTPASFIFSAKLYQKFTHPDMFLARGGVGDWDVTRGDVDQFRRGIDPLAEQQRLGALLIQFPSSFHAEPDTRAYLEWLLEVFAGYPLAVELRHESWYRDAATTRELLVRGQATWTVIDQPGIGGVKHGSDPFDVPKGSDPCLTPYFRLHGRNAENWWRHEESEDRYNYLYSAAELEPFAEAALRSARDGRKVFLYLNNHFSAKAVANAAVLRHQIGDLVPGDYPREMTARYPALAGIVATSGLPL
ncbi:MAG TPA: DUF72 domain-containing protein [Vicinamibacterales bacterium]|nr:DUF72 domain-containing protein [Vicinamibacterales bacterium]